MHTVQLFDIILARSFKLRERMKIMDLNTLKKKMDEAHYIYDDTLATVLAVALQLGRPLLIEGAAGVGKTEIAKVMASA